MKPHTYACMYYVTWKTIAPFGSLYTSANNTNIATFDNFASAKEYEKALRDILKAKDIVISHVISNDEEADSNETIS